MLFLFNYFVFLDSWLTKLIDFVFSRLTVQQQSQITNFQVFFHSLVFQLDDIILKSLDFWSLFQ